MFTPIEQYMQKTRDDRRAHLQLSAECIEIGGHASTVFKGLLAHYLKTTIPAKHSAYLCHACNNPKCSNVLHLYWGTPKDNYADMRDAGTAVWRQHAWKNHHAKQKKWGQELGKKYGGQRRLTAEKLQQIKRVLDAIPKGWGWKQKAARELNVSHTQLNRYLKQLAKNHSPVL